MKTEPFYTVKALCERYGVRPMTIRRWIAAGIFPAPLRIGRRKVYWPVQVIRQHEAAAAEAAGISPETLQEEAVSK